MRSETALRYLHASFALRAAIATLICVFVGLIVSSLTAASQIRYRTDETQSAVLLSEHYETLERLLWKEAGQIRVHGVEQQDSSWTENVQDERLVGIEIEGVLAMIRAAGDAHDLTLVSNTEQSHAEYTDLLRTLFAQIDSRDTAAPETFRNCTHIFDRMQTQIDRRAAYQHEAAVAALQRLSLTQRAVMQMIIVSSLVGTVLIVISGTLVIRFQKKIMSIRQEELERFRAASLTDILTGLANNRAFIDELDSALVAARRVNASLSLALIDVDGFKLVNDTRGHLEGDRILSCLGKLLREMRAGDRTFRLGGDEFCVLLPNTNASEAEVVMDRLRRSAAEALGGTTISVGVSSTNGFSTNADRLRSNADEALYAAKRRGRNLVQRHEDVKKSISEKLPEGEAEVKRGLSRFAIDRSDWPPRSGPPDFVNHSA